MNGQRTITRLAGRFTPAESVEVDINTRSEPCLKAPSIMSRSSKVKPIIEKIQLKYIDMLKISS